MEGADTNQAVPRSPPARSGLARAASTVTLLTSLALASGLAACAGDEENAIGGLVVVRYDIRVGDGFRVHMRADIRDVGAPPDAAGATVMFECTLECRCIERRMDGSKVMSLGWTKYSLAGTREAALEHGGKQVEQGELRGVVVLGRHGHVERLEITAASQELRNQLERMFRNPLLLGIVPTSGNELHIGESVNLLELSPASAFDAMVGPQWADGTISVQGELILERTLDVAGEVALSWGTRIDVSQSARLGNTTIRMRSTGTGTLLQSMRTGLPVGVSRATMEVSSQSDASGSVRESRAIISFVSEYFPL